MKGGEEGEHGSHHNDNEMATKQGVPLWLTIV
jgi:hypothetical protein